MIRAVNPEPIDVGHKEPRVRPLSLLKGKANGKLGRTMTDPAGPSVVIGD